MLWQSEGIECGFFKSFERALVSLVLDWASPTTVGVVSTAEIQLTDMQLSGTAAAQAKQKLCSMVMTKKCVLILPSTGSPQPALWRWNQADGYCADFLAW